MVSCWKSLLATVFLLICHSYCTTTGKYFRTSCKLNIEKFLNNLTDYDRFVPPGKATYGSTTVVYVKLYIESIGNYRSESMDYDLDTYFIMMWSDNRLRHNETEMLYFNDDKLIKRKVWVPDIYFTNSKFASYTYVTVPNFNFRIFPNGTVRYSMRMFQSVVKSFMSYELQNVSYRPTNLCPGHAALPTMSTCNSSTEQEFATNINNSRRRTRASPVWSRLDNMNDNRSVDVRWFEKSPISSNTHAKEADLTLDKCFAFYCDGTYEDLYYSCLNATFRLRREITSSLLATYVPTFFIVMISWISFWIDPSSVPARVGLSITTLLTFSTQSAGIRQGLPPVSYAKALDFWLFACLSFLFGALVEFAIVNMYYRASSSAMKKANKTENSKKDDDLLEKQPVVSDENLIELRNGTDHSSHTDLYASRWDRARFFHRRAVNIDRFSRVVFPVAFLVFVTVYCTYCFFTGQAGWASGDTENHCKSN